MNSDPPRLIVRGRRVPVAVAILLTIAVPGLRAPAQSTRSAPAHPNAPGPGGLEVSRLSRIDDLMAEAIRDGQCPGGVVLVGLGDRILWRKAYGNRQVEPDRQEMTVQTVFDMASCTKIIATATSVAILIDRGRVALSDPVAKYIPEFAANGKGEITVEQLLTHTSGLIPDNSLKDYADGPEAAMKKIYGLGLHVPTGTFAYSDLNYIVLGELVRRVAGMPLDEFAHREIFVPASMKMTTFRPPQSWRAWCAPTEKRNGAWIVGEVHDPRAYALGGVAGHAGLFSTADDVARWCRMILNGGEIDGTRILSAKMVAEMTRPRAVGPENRLRGLGFDILTGYSSPRGELFPAGRSFGHTGFTGTSLWIDPTSKMYVIILTNSVHPNGKGNVIALRRKIGTVAASAVYPAEADRLAAVVGSALPQAGEGQTTVRKGDPMQSHSTAVKNAQVLTGLDVLVRDGFRQLAGRNVGVITNHTARSRDGQFIVDLLARAPNVKLVALFAPEHGFRGLLDEKVQDEKDPATGLTIYSLYGKTNTPTEEMLRGVDTLVFDIQDVGARFYTYETTMGNCMKAA
ncbi:MAG TPA: serine hydrolase, partial [Phycisphaerae bacterium]|nr:serine hydrolase [Phycisphaerae bacterium]